MQLCIITDARGQDRAFHPNYVAEIQPAVKNEQYPDSNTLIKFKELDGRVSYAYMKESVREIADMVNKCLR